MSSDLSGKIFLRRQNMSDAERFFEILDNDNFLYFSNRPKNVDAERKFLSRVENKAKRNFEHNYAIIYDGVIVGGCGIKIDQHRTYIGEIGYFVDETYWGKGIATETVRLLEKIGFDEFGLKRIIILMNPDNVGSVKVAEKADYKKEGIMRKMDFDKKTGKMRDFFLYSKVVDER